MGVICSMHEQMRNSYTILVGKMKGIDHLGFLQDNIKMDLTDCEDVDWINFAQNKVQRLF